MAVARLAALCRVTQRGVWRPSPLSYRMMSLDGTEDEGPTRTTLDAVVVNKSRPYITAYSPRGFVISGKKVFGPVAILPSCFLQWKVMRKEDISADSLALFNVIYPKLEILVLGLGDRIARLHPSVKKRLLQDGITVEAMDTANACSTFNYLASENRVVGAALIPVTKTS